jgi:hypothetical protein
LVLTGLTPTTTENTSVDVFYERMVTTPIGPGPGVFFMPTPAGFFDVAAFLVREHATNVPTDLSVLIAANGSVPEPASLVMGGIAVAAAVGLVITRRLKV